MGTLTNLNGTVQTQIPEDIARDSEVAAAITAHNIADWVHIEYLWRVFLPRDRTGHWVGYITDTEVASLIANHTAAVDPHPTYLTQPEGDGRYRQTATPLVDGDIPAAIARDVEVASAIASHVNNSHSVALALLKGSVAGVGIESIIFIPATISTNKIVSILAEVPETLGSSGTRFIIVGGEGWFNDDPRIVFGSIRIPAAAVSQLVGLPINVLVWYEV